MKAARTNWDAIVTGAPLNKDAAVARDGRGISFDIPEHARINAFDAPFALKPYEDIPANNLTGQRFQKLVVLGLRDCDGNGPASWACRCDCGRYASFKAAKLKKQRQLGRAMCSECDYFAEIQADRHPTKDEAAARAAEKAERKERRQSVDAMTHPKLLELRAALSSLGISNDEFSRSLAEFVRVKTAQPNGPSTTASDDIPGGNKLDNSQEE